VQVNGARLLADEAGDFTFASGTNISRYFIVCTIMMHNCKIGDDLLALRRELARNRAPLRDYFHASSDAQVIRGSVCDLIKNYSFTIQANVMQKSKVQPQVRVAHHKFHKYGWLYLYLLRHGNFPFAELVVKPGRTIDLDIDPRFRPGPSAKASLDRN
jgi:hypothetical protein